METHSHTWVGLAAPVETMCTTTADVANRTGWGGGGPCNLQEDGSVFGLQVCPRRGRLYFSDDCAECHEQLPRVHRRTGSTFNYRICPVCYDDIVGFLKRRLRVLTNHGTTDIIMGFLTSLR